MQENIAAVQYVAKRKDKKALIGRIITLIVAAIILVAVSQIDAIKSYLMVLVVGIVLITSAIMRNFSVEYQYLVSDGNFFVEAVFGVSKRKNALSVEISSITEHAACNTDKADELANRAKKVLDFSSSPDAEGRICFFSEEDSLCFIIEPNEEILSFLCGGHN